MSMSTQQLRDLGYRLVDGKAVRIDDNAVEMVVERPKKARRGVMNKTEAAFASYLERQKIAGDVIHYAFEQHKIMLANGAWYTVDFICVGADHRVTFYEIKGFWREAARVRIKVAAEKNRWAKFIVVTRVSGEWKFETIE